MSTHSGRAAGVSERGGADAKDGEGYTIPLEVTCRVVGLVNSCGCHIAQLQNLCDYRFYYCRKALLGDASCGAAVLEQGVWPACTATHGISTAQVPFKITMVNSPGSRAIVVGRKEDGTPETLHSDSNLHRQPLGRHSESDLGDGGC
jgi:hypothetical protein